MDNFIKIKDEIEKQSTLIPVNRIMFIETDVDFDKCINNKPLDGWYIHFYLGNQQPDETVPKTFLFDNKEDIKEILKQLEKNK